MDWDLIGDTAMVSVAALAGCGIARVLAAKGPKTSGDLWEHISRDGSLISRVQDWRLWNVWGRGGDWFWNVLEKAVWLGRAVLYGVVALLGGAIFFAALGYWAGSEDSGEGGFISGSMVVAAYIGMVWGFVWPVTRAAKSAEEERSSASSVP